ncbi:MAG TPA: response regulator [Blastocatellia bacterium]|nr:response regulator [Blastocatellia bacterium]
MKKIGVLVVDDEPSVCDALRLILDDNGFETAVALTAADGLERTRHDKFALTVIDFRLPDMSGIELLTRIIQNDPDSTAIIITGYYSPELAREAVIKGAADVLAKPFEPSVLLNSANRVLSEFPASARDVTP